MRQIWVRGYTCTRNVLDAMIMQGRGSTVRPGLYSKLSDRMRRDPFGVGVRMLVIAAKPNLSVGTSTYMRR
jgi:hypothetical protein